jgi:hypothetical protein
VRFSSLIEGTSAADLGDGVVQAAHVSHAFIDRRVLSMARSLPWSLTRGNISVNLNNLTAQPYEGRDATTVCIYELAMAGFSRATLEDGIALLGDVPWTTVSAEQGHGTMAQIHRQHPQYSPDMVALRTSFSQARTLFQRDSDDSALRRNNSRLERLRRKQPNKVSPASVYYSDVVASLRGLAGVQLPALSV